MNFIQTLYFDKSINPLSYRFGWPEPEFHLMSWALSSLLMNTVYDKLDLYCNSGPADLLIDKLELPYNKVDITTHEDFILPDKSLWALPKIVTYSLQSEPFIHLDGDVFLFSKLPDCLLASRLVSQNLEEASQYHLAAKKQIEESLKYLPCCMRNDFKLSKPLKTLNAGIIGGNDIDFIHQFSEIALRLVYDNIEDLNKINTDAFNVFFEQHLFYSLAKEKNIEVAVLFEDLVENNNYIGLGDFHEAPFKRNYLHLLGNYKRDEFTCIQMASRLRALYPEYFYRILSLFKKNNSEHILSIYADKEFSSVNEYLAFNKKAKLTYSQWIKNKDEKEVGVIKAINVSLFSEVSTINQFIQEIDYSGLTYTKQEVNKDFDLFIQQMQSNLESLSQNYSRDYLYGRDLSAEDWFSFLFSDEKQVHEKLVIACGEIFVLKSAYDWAGLINKWKRKGARYYENLELEKGEYYSIVVAEFFDNSFSIYDLDDMEKIILEKLSKPLSINELIGEMKEYVDEEVVNDYFEKYIDLIIVFVKQLVLKKAIRPSVIDNSTIG